MSMLCLHIWMSRSAGTDIYITTGYERGVPTTGAGERDFSQRWEGPKQTGTSINFLPDPEIFEKTSISPQHESQRADSMRLLI